MKAKKVVNLNRGPALCSSKGFTLMEVLLVIGLITIVASFGLFVSMDSYNSSSFQNDRNLLVSTLMRARSESINNVCLSTTSSPCTDGKPHGVHLDTSGGLVTQYVLFQGTTYNPTDPINEIIKTNHYLTISGTTDVYFTELSDSVTTPVTITLKDNSTSTSDINIGGEGQITWTN
jgi:prepilin-type N-terminal cleavage/methylation domain-containing protein